MAKILCVFAGIMLLKILTLILLQGVLTSRALVKSEITPGDLRDSQLSDTTEAKSRQKRCTCYSYKDKECVYYCHLDIIWINTPERTVPYGMSSYRGLQRSRRAARGRPSEREEPSTPRCVCVVTDGDPECRDFCLSSSLQTLPIRSLHRVPGLGWQFDPCPSSALLLGWMDPSLSLWPRPSAFGIWPPQVHTVKGRTLEFTSADIPQHHNSWKQVRSGRVIFKNSPAVLMQIPGGFSPLFLPESSLTISFTLLMSSLIRSALCIHT